MNKVWIYISNRLFAPMEEERISEEIVLFLQQWKAHENPLKANFSILYHSLIVIEVEEEEFKASGCSIDKLLRFIKELENKFSIELLNRLLVAYKIEENLYFSPSIKIPELLSAGEIDENTLIVNSGISSSKELNEKLFIPLKESWLQKFLQPN